MSRCGHGLASAQTNVENIHKPDVLEGVMVHTNVHDNLCSGAGTQAWYMWTSHLMCTQACCFCMRPRVSIQESWPQHEHNKIAQYHVLSFYNINEVYTHHQNQGAALRPPGTESLESSRNNLIRLRVTDGFLHPDPRVMSVQLTFPRLPVSMVPAIFVCRPSRCKATATMIPPDRR